MLPFRQIFGINNSLVQYLRMSPLDCIIQSESGLGAIYVGNLYAAFSVEILKNHNITAVLTVAAGTGLKYKPENNINHMVIPAEDVPSFNLSRYFPKMIEFISQNREENRNILVHCFAGISRSSTSLICYMIDRLNFTFPQALKHCQNRRKQIHPNTGFTRQLIQFQENKLQNIQKINNPEIKIEKRQAINQEICKIMEKHKQKIIFSQVTPKVDIKEINLTKSDVYQIHTKRSSSTKNNQMKDLNNNNNFKQSGNNNSLTINTI